MANIFLAAPSADMNSAYRAIREIRTAGHEITCDWTRFLERTDYTEPELEVIARTVRKGVEDANYVIALVPAGIPISVGVGWELGYANALKKTIFLVEHSSDRALPASWRDHPYRQCVTTRYKNLQAVLIDIRSLEKSPATSPSAVAGDSKEWAWRERGDQYATGSFSTRELAIEDVKAKRLRPARIEIGHVDWPDPGKFVPCAIETFLEWMEEEAVSQGWDGSDDMLFEGIASIDEVETAFQAHMADWIRKWIRATTWTFRVVEEIELDAVHELP